MANKLFHVLILVFIIAGFSYSQEKNDTTFDHVNIKGLSQADMERIFGNFYKSNRTYKVNGDPHAIKSVIVSGNRITTVIFNYGSICKPNYLSNIADLVWKGLGYGFEFGPLAGGQIIQQGKNGKIDTLHIVDDSFVLPSQGSYSPDGSLKWGWLPKDGYADPNQDKIATLNAPDENGDGKPDSWPQRWYSPGAGKYLWPAFLGDQATAPDAEAYYVMDDFTNQEFPYYPFPSDSSKRGLGLDAEVRTIQFNNSLAQDILFLVYRITNVSEKSLPLMYFGMQGDPHVGGAADYSDDYAFFIPPKGPLAEGTVQRARSMVYAYDNPPIGMDGRTTGYFGWKFLESPTNSNDGIDNDDDGMLDESPFNTHGNYIDGVNIPLTHGISDVAKYTAIYGAPHPRYEGDENGNWDPAKDDIGIDGIGPDSPNYPGPDYGEGDGVPTQAWFLDQNGDNKYEKGEPLSEEKLPGYIWAGSEPNFGLRDVAESDQLGLTEFHAAAYTNSLPNVPKNTPLMWEWLSSDSINPNQTLLQQPGDNIFNFGTGPLSLDRGATQRFSMAILFGDNLTDLKLNAETSTRVLEANYEFAQPPAKPIVTAVPGDHKVTLYWDAKAEQSVDPLTGEKDFEGYKIYRSRDYTFSDVYTITDGNGVPFLGTPLTDAKGNKAQWDLVDSLSGYFPIPYQGRGIEYYLGNNTGLVHQYVDSTALNGITYYYAVVSYDGGSLEPGKELPPSECQAVIKKDPITGQLKYDVNTVAVTPGPLPSGIKDADAGIGGTPQQVTGNSTGKITVKVLDDLKVQAKTYKISFANDTTYQVLDSTGVTDNLLSKDTVFVALSNKNIEPGSFQLFDASGNLINSQKYFVNYESGRVRGLKYGDLPAGESFTAKYRYYPVPGSSFLNNQDANPTFDGMRVFVKNNPLALDYENSGFNDNSINVKDTLVYPPIIGDTVKYRADFEVRWNNLDTTATGAWANPGDTVIDQNLYPTICPFRIFDVSNNKPASYVIYEPMPSKIKNGKWDWGEYIVLRPTGSTGFETTWEIIFNLPDSGVTPVLPKSGSIYTVKTTKPFQKGDTYVFNSTTTQFEPKAATSALDNVYVVPNPYVVYSEAENPGRLVGQRGDKDLQFRNLPPKCTIKIFTAVGELVQTIQKNDMSSIAHWNLLSYEGQKVAYGVYIYYVDAPGVGKKIGRFALIK